MTGVLGTLLSLAAGYMYVRVASVPSGLKKLAHALYITSLAIPGLALGLAFAMFFRGTPIYNTIMTSSTAKKSFCTGWKRPERTGTTLRVELTCFLLKYRMSSR